MATTVNNIENTSINQFEDLMGNGYALNFKRNVQKTITLFKQYMWQQIGFIITFTVLAWAFSSVEYLGEIAIILLPLIFWASTFKITQKLTSLEPLSEKDAMLGLSHTWDLFMLSLKVSLFMFLPLILLALLVVAFPILESVWIGIGGLWLYYCLTSYCLAILLMVIYKLEDWTAIYTSRKLVRHHFWFFLITQVLIVLPSFIGVTSIAFLIQFMSIYGLGIFFYVMLSEALKAQE